MLEFESENQPMSTSSATAAVPEAELTRLLAALPPAERVKFSCEALQDVDLTIERLQRILAHERSVNMATAFVTRVVAISAMLALAWWNSLDAYPLIKLVNVVVLFLAGGGVLLRKSESAVEKAALICLVGIEDKRVIGALLEQMQHVSEENRGKVAAALSKLLPRLKQEDMALLTGVQRDQLNACLHLSLFPGSAELHIAVLAVLEQIGDRDAFGVLYGLSGAHAPTKSEQAVRSAAQKCLYNLQDRLDYGVIDDIPDYLRTVYTAIPGEAIHLIDGYSLYALLHLLPLLTPSNYSHKLSPEDRHSLYKLLSPAVQSSHAYGQMAFFREVVRTLERVADTSSIPVLRPIAGMMAPTDGEKQLRAAAKDAIRTLRRQIEKEKESKTLLRGSSAPDTLPSELLRPAEPAPSITQPSELLRASTPEPPALRFPGAPSPQRRE